MYQKQFNKNLTEENIMAHQNCKRYKGDDDWKKLSLNLLVQFIATIKT